MAGQPYLEPSDSRYTSATRTEAPVQGLTEPSLGWTTLLHQSDLARWHSAEWRFR